MLLVVTSKQDVHADAVIHELNKRHLPVFRLNTEDVLSKYQISLQIDVSGIWAGTVTDELGRVVNLENLQIAWIRRPDFPFENAEDGVQKFVMAEVRALISCLYALPNITFMNETFDAQRAKTKFQQLIHASELGIRIPRTIMTNSPHEAERFAERAEGDLLVKAIYTGNIDRGEAKQGLPSRKISRDRLFELCELVRNCPVQIQDYVEKNYEIRVTVVGENVFAVKIDSQLNELTKVDWRPHTALNPHSAISLPDKIAIFCRTYIREQRLLFGAMDFIVDSVGRYVFLENNPSGQYLWLEDETGVPITDALVELFAERMRPDKTVPGST